MIGAIKRWFRRRILRLKEDVRFKGTWRFIFDDGTIIEEENLITTSGLGILAALICGDQDNSCSFVLGWGTGVTAAAAGDTSLETESSRKQVTTKTRSSSTVILSTFLYSTEANGTWTEFGVYVAGTLIAGTGTLLNRILPVGGVTKTAGTNLTVEIDIALAAA